MTTSGGKKAGPAAAGAILQTGQAFFEKTLSPFADNLAGNSQLRSDLFVFKAFGSKENGLRSNHVNIR
jgi:hypothetical protein